ncbi:hypothetical protein [Polaribacter atrinae]|uniref:Uncharacterized protein n=1 Tax=Polaribacter atrinae TaxID=1333662 RepID=A0A176T9N7_9FLAO|nr:hypothetical protein [Polaribacter atrinae]OAD44600.1 hypothetical protein LPB303_11745 [Polaribacter atrinae]
MNKSSKIVRTKTTNGSEKNLEEMYYEIEFMTFEKYVSELNKYNEYNYIGKPKFEKYPYKWYDLRKIYQIPSHYFFHKLNVFFNRKINFNKTKTTAMYLTVFIMESLSAWLIVEFVKLVIKNLHTE